MTPIPNNPYTHDHSNPRRTRDCPACHWERASSAWETDTAPADLLLEDTDEEQAFLPGNPADYGDST